MHYRSFKPSHIVYVENRSSSRSSRSSSRTAAPCRLLMEDNSSLSQLVSWLQSVGIWWDKSLVQIRGGCSNCSGPALGVFAVSDVQENQLLCVIPRSAILSPRTTQPAQILEAEKLGGGLALTIAVMYEASLGKASKWAGYFASLPAREYLPMFWSQDELDALAGTALEGVACDDRRDTQDDYEAHVVPLMAKHKEAFPHPKLCSLQHFRTAASWVASRSFHVDAWHGDAMVPLADIFNHKASLVLLEDGWQVAEEADRQQQQQQQQQEHDEAAADGSDEAAAEAGTDLHADGSADAGDESSTDGSSAHSIDDDEGGDDGEDDPQHGFAVGGMPVIAAAAAAGVGAAGLATAGIVHKAAGCWVRDGVNLRLEIGICSVGPPDTLLASMTDPGSAAAAAAAAAGDSHHTHGVGCSGHGEAAKESTEEAQQEQQKRRDASPPELASQQQKKQKTDQKQEEAAEPLEATTRQQQQQQQQQFPEKRLEIVAASPVPAGAEVHNTYGELGNQALVHKYGFCLPCNPFDEVGLGPGWPWLLREVAAAAGLGRRLEQHVAWLELHSHLLSPAADADATRMSQQGSSSRAARRAAWRAAAVCGGCRRAAAGRLSSAAEGLEQLAGSIAG
ncbi:hypothetical protein COO60DRAFT_557117 [Scenedesmus sp. NREL 46B-D3]|nr:hypothetical protein COO60DRAFT_557117 [Scenedesmus sp. NREL 46B-D3]